MGSFFTTYFSTLRQLLTGDGWWSSVFQCLREALLQQPVAVAAILAGVACLVLVGYYGLMRGMHKTYWIRDGLIGLCGLCALSAGVGAALTYSTRNLPEHLTGQLEDWLKVMQNPACWPTDPGQSTLDAMHSEGKRISRVRSTAGVQCWEISLPLEEGDQFEIAARAFAAPAIQAFREDFPLISGFFVPQSAPIERKLAESSLQYWKARLASHDLSRPRLYKEDSIRRVLNGLGRQTRPVLHNTGLSLQLHLALFALLAGLIGAAAVFLDCRWKLIHPETEK